MGGKPRYVALPLPKNRNSKLGECLNKHSGFLLRHLGLLERGPKRYQDRSLSGIVEKARYVLWQRFCRSELKSSNLTKEVQNELKTVKNCRRPTTSTKLGRRCQAPWVTGWLEERRRATRCCRISSWQLLLCSGNQKCSLQQSTTKPRSSLPVGAMPVKTDSSASPSGARP